MASTISPDDIAFLAALSGIEVPPEDLSPLAEALENYRRATEVLFRIDFGEFMPVVEVRWHG